MKGLKWLTEPTYRKRDGENGYSSQTCVHHSGIGRQQLGQLKKKWQFSFEF